MLITLKTQTENFVRSSRFEENILCCERKRIMINKAITPGEISELIRKQLEIDKDLNKRMISIQKAISAER